MVGPTQAQQQLVRLSEMALPTGLNWPTVDEYKDWARIRDTSDDVAIDQALSAVMEAIVARAPSLATADCPTDVLYATLLWTNRLLSRRNSPDGIVGCLLYTSDAATILRV